MMFRSLFFIAPLVSADEQTAMLQLNRRGEVSQQTAHDMMVGSLEQSLMAKEPEKTSDTAKCTYYLKTVHATTLLQKMSELKGEEKTQQLLQRAMDSVGAENLRSLEENLMSKDEDKKEENKDSEKKLTPCEVLTELRHAFKHNMQHYREIRQKTQDTGRKIGDLIGSELKKAAQEARTIMEGAKGKSGLALQAVENEAHAAFAKVSLDAHKDKIVAFEGEEAKKAVEALDEVIPKLKGSAMAATIKAAREVLHAKVKDYEHTAIQTVDQTLKITELFANFTAPADKAAGFTQEEVNAVITAVTESLAKTEEDVNTAVDSAVETILKPYVAYVFKTDVDKIWTAFADLWRAKNVLNTDATAFVMQTAPNCDGKKDCLDIGDDLFWQQASGYLADAHVEPTCMTSAFKGQGHDFVPRKVCDGDHPSLECADEFLYLAKKAGKNATATTDVCTNTVEKTELPNDTKLSDDKFKNITELKFLEDADTTTHACEKWEDIKDACKSIKA